MKPPLFIAPLALLLASCGALQGAGPSASAVIPAEATKAARRSAAVPYPTATGGPATPQPAVTAAPAGTSAPAASSAAAAALPAFSCEQQSGGQTQPAAIVSSRLASHSGYDRFVLEFDTGVPSYRVAHQDSATFVESGSGRNVTLEGSNGLLIDVRPTTGHGGSSDAKISHNGVSLEARKIGDFEGVTRWGIGMSQHSCFRVFTLTAPPRLVVDIAPAP